MYCRFIILRASLYRLPSKNYNRAIATGCHMLEISSKICKTLNSASERTSKTFAHFKSFSRNHTKAKHKQANQTTKQKTNKIHNSRSKREKGVLGALDRGIYTVEPGTPSLFSFGAWKKMLLVALNGVLE